MWEYIAVGLLVAAAAILVARRLVRGVKGESCSSCGNCPESGGSCPDPPARNDDDTPGQ